MNKTSTKKNVDPALVQIAVMKMAEAEGIDPLFVATWFDTVPAKERAKIDAATTWNRLWTAWVMSVATQAVAAGSFDLAHRLLVTLESSVTGRDPDLTKLCSPREAVLS